MVKKSGSGSGIRIRDEQPWSYFRELRTPFLGWNTLILWCGSGIRDGKIRIRDTGNNDRRDPSTVIYTSAICDVQDEPCGEAAASRRVLPPAHLRPGVDRVRSRACSQLRSRRQARNNLKQRDEKISRGPTFVYFVTARTERSMQAVTVARLQSTRVQTRHFSLYYL